MALYFDPVLLAAGALLLSVASVVMATVLAVRQRRLMKKYRVLLRLPSGTDLEQLLLHQSAILERLQQDQTNLMEQVNALRQSIRSHVQKTGIVRFSAFPDTGSDLSFAVALLDADDNGVVFSSLYGRNESRVYAKPIVGGNSTYPLSDEEREAIARATAKPRAAAE